MSQPVQESSAPAENLYAEVEHVKPFKEPAEQHAMYYPDLSNVAVSRIALLLRPAWVLSHFPLILK